MPGNGYENNLDGSARDGFYAKEGCKYPVKESDNTRDAAILKMTSIRGTLEVSPLVRTRYA